MTNPSTPTSAPAEMTARQKATEKQKAKQKALRGALATLSTEAGVRKGGSPIPVEAHVAALETGKITKDGKEKTLSLADTAKIVLKVLKLGGSVPAVVRSRFPWTAVSRETLATVAETGGVAPATFFAAIGIAPDSSQEGIDEDGGGPMGDADESDSEASQGPSVAATTPARMTPARPNTRRAR